MVEQLVAVVAVALLELPGLPDAEREAEDQPVGGTLHPHPPIGEGCGRDLVLLAVQGQRPAEDVAQLARPPCTVWAVRLRGVGEVADLVREAELVLSCWGNELAREGVRAPDLGPGVAQEAHHHVCTRMAGAGARTESENAIVLSRKPSLSLADGSMSARTAIGLCSASTLSSYHPSETTVQESERLWPRAVSRQWEPSA